MSKAEDINGGKIFVSKAVGFPQAFLKLAVDKLNDKLGASVIVLVSVVKADKLGICVKVSDEFVKKGINAGKIVAEIAEATGGKGGGRPNFAQGGGKDESKLDDVLLKIKNDLKNV